MRCEDDVVKYLAMEATPLHGELAAEETKDAAAEAPSPR